jgi:hypothetical protein
MNLSKQQLKLFGLRTFTQTQTIHHGAHVNKSHFIDIVRNEILVEHQKSKCEICGFHMSYKFILIYSKEWEDSDNLHVCDNCHMEIVCSGKFQILD